MEIVDKEYHITNTSKTSFSAVGDLTVYHH